MKRMTTLALSLVLGSIITAALHATPVMVLSDDFTDGDYTASRIF